MVVGERRRLTALCAAVVFVAIIVFPAQGLKSTEVEENGQVEKLCRSLWADYRFAGTRKNTAGDATRIHAHTPELSFSNTFIGKEQSQVANFNERTGLWTDDYFFFQQDSAYTIQVWFRMDATEGEQKILDSSDMLSDSGLYLKNGMLIFRQTAVNHEKGGVHRTKHMNVLRATHQESPIKPEEWVMLSFVRDPMHTVTVYLNGKNVLSFDDSKSMDGVFREGKISFFTGKNRKMSASGQVARIVIFKRALTPEKMTQALSHLPKYFKEEMKGKAVLSMNFEERDPQKDMATTLRDTEKKMEKEKKAIEDHIAKMEARIAAKKGASRTKIKGDAKQSKKEVKQTVKKSSEKEASDPVKALETEIGELKKERDAEAEKVARDEKKAAAARTKKKHTHAVTDLGEDAPAAPKEQHEAPKEVPAGDPVPGDEPAEGATEDEDEKSEGELTPREKEEKKFWGYFPFDGEFENLGYGKDVVLQHESNEANFTEATIGENSGMERRQQVYQFGKDKGFSLQSDQFLETNEEYTLFVLFKLDEVDGYRNIINFNNTHKAGVFVLDGHVVFYPGYKEDVDGRSLKAGEWIHVTVTKAKNREVKVFVNGERKIFFRDNDGLSKTGRKGDIQFFTSHNKKYTTGGAISLLVADFKKCSEHELSVAEWAKPVPRECNIKAEECKGTSKLRWTHGRCVCQCPLGYSGDRCQIKQDNAGKDMVVKGPDGKKYDVGIEFLNGQAVTTVRVEGKGETDKYDKPVSLPKMDLTDGTKKEEDECVKKCHEDKDKEDEEQEGEGEGEGEEPADGAAEAQGGEAPVNAPKADPAPAAEPKADDNAAVDKKDPDSELDEKKSDDHDLSVEHDAESDKADNKHRRKADSTHREKSKHHERTRDVRKELHKAEEERRKAERMERKLRRELRRERRRRRHENDDGDDDDDDDFDSEDDV